MQRWLSQTPRVAQSFKRVVATHNAHLPLDFAKEKDTINVSRAPNKAKEEQTISTIPGLFVFHDFITPEEEQTLLKDVEPDLRARAYELSHWDSVIAGYRELACRSKWSSSSLDILDRVRHHVFRPPFRQLDTNHSKPESTETGVLPVHVLDIARDGYMRPHVDSVKFSGGVVAGLNLLAPVVLTLQPAVLDHQGIEIHSGQTPPGYGVSKKKYMTVSDDDDDEEEVRDGKKGNDRDRLGGKEDTGSHFEEWDLSSNIQVPPLKSLFDPEKTQVQVLLRPRTLYMMADECRYNWSHGIEIPSLHNFARSPLTRKRRIVIMMRDALAS